MDKPTNKRLSFLINVAYFAVVCLLVYAALKYALGLVLPFLLALGIVTIVTPLVRKLTGWLKIRQSTISLAVMLVMYIVLGSLLLLLVIQIVSGVQYLMDQAPGIYSDYIRPAVMDIWAAISDLIKQLPEAWQKPFAGVEDSLTDTLQNFALDAASGEGTGFSLLTGTLPTILSISQKSLSALTGSIPNFFIAFIFTIMLSFLIGSQYDKVVAFLKNQMPPKAVQIVRDLKSIIWKTIFRYLGAVLKLMCITFIEMSIGLLILRQPNAILIALIIAAFDALPVFGTGAIVIPWILIKLLLGDYSFALGLLILYVVVTIIRNIIEPKIVGDNLGLNPIVSLVSIYLGFKLFGVFGMIFMPILTQIAIELHKRGTVRLYRESPPLPEEGEAKRPHWRGPKAQQGRKHQKL